MSDITQQIKKYCIEILMAQANSAFDAVPDYFTTLGNNAPHPNDRNFYLESMHDLAFDRNKMLKRFQNKLEEAFNDLTGAPRLVANHQIGGVDTSRINELDDLEEKLAIETMINKSESKTDLPMQSIIRSINALMGDGWMQDNTNPLESEIIIKAWMESVHQSQLPVKGYLALYGLFDTELLEYLPKIYEKIGRYLDSLPIRGQQAVPSVNSSNEDELGDFEDAFADIDEPNVAAEFSNSDYTTEEFQAETDGQPAAEKRTEFLVQLLNRLQRKRDIDESSFYSSNYLLDLRGLLKAYDAVPEGEINPWTVGQINDDVIDMVGLLFRYIMDDAHLPDDIRLQTARLQIPYLKLGLQDKSLFSNKEHPARLLLNHLAQAISLWDPTHHGGIDKLLSETSVVIENILNHYEYDTAIFSQTYTQFDAFLKGTSHTDEQMPKRQSATLSNTDKADNARLLIESTLLKICDNKRIPPVIDKILEEYWSKVLFLEYLKTGEHSEEFQEFIQTAVILVDSVQPKNSADQRKAMAKTLPGIIKKLKKGLTTISVASFETVDVFRDLQECHMLILKERPEELEVSDSDYADFQAEQDVVVDWNRADLENALLEESIERSLNRDDADLHAFDDNKNIFSSKKDIIHDATQTKAMREKEIIDNELKEARDAYELALKDHQEKKALENPVESDDFMTQFFQDPDFIQKQYEGTRDLSAEDDAHILKESDDLVDDDIFTQLEQSTTLPPKPKPYEIEINDRREESREDDQQRREKQRFHDHNIPEQVQPVVSTEDSNTDIDGRAHGALDVNELEQEMGDDKVTELIARLKVGLWLDLMHADGTKVRAKIMAIIPTVGKYIFGDRRGHKIADYNRQSLAEALRSGAIVINENDNDFDKTLESVIANLRVLKKAKDD